MLKKHIVFALCANVKRLTCDKVQIEYISPTRYTEQGIQKIGFITSNYHNSNSPELPTDLAQHPAKTIAQPTTTISDTES